MSEKQLYLICYDISLNKQRTKVAELLELYGARLNKSVFECFLTKNQAKQVNETIKKAINPKTDTVIFYFVCQNCYAKSWMLGRYTKGSISNTQIIE